MSKFYNKFTNLVGSAPLLELSNFARKEKLKAKIIAKLEYFNPPISQSQEIATAKEIWAETEGHVDIFVAEAGSCSFISKIGRALKRRKPNIKIVAVEPVHNISVNNNDINPHLDLSAVDEIIPVSDEEAIATSHKLARKEGLNVGLLSSAAIAAAVKLALRPENEAKNIVAILPDNGEYSISTALFG